MAVRLGKSVKRLETRAEVDGRSARDRGCGFVISYTPDNVTVDASKLAAGELVALDVFVIDRGRMRTTERVTTDPDDLGFVYDPDGAMVGRVVEVDRPYFSYCLQEGCADPLVGPGNTSGEGGNRE